MQVSQEFIEAVNTFTRRYLVWWAYGLALLELILVVLRWKGIHVMLVSQVARDIAFRGLTSFAFFFGSMAAHWFITWHRPTWDGLTANILGLFFWLVFLAYFLADMFDPKHEYWPLVTQWLRYPPVVALIGAALAYTCFPQKSQWFPGGP